MCVCLLNLFVPCSSKTDELNGLKSQDLKIVDFIQIGGTQEILQNTGESGIIQSASGYLDTFITLSLEEDMILTLPDFGHSLFLPCFMSTLQWDHSE